MPTQEQANAVGAALVQIRSAEKEISDLIDNASSNDLAKDLNAILNQFTTVATNLAQAQTIADDALFKTVTSKLKDQAVQLQKQEVAMQKVLVQADKAGKIVGYVGQAISAIAKL
jgi:hypothetical protein